MSYFENQIIILNTKHFSVFVPSTPHIDRTDGGHICVCCTDDNKYYLQDLSDLEVLELGVLLKLIGKIMMCVLNENGVDVGLVNYQINGNWTYNHPDKPLLHAHIYGRAFSAKVQRFGQALNFPLKKDNEDFYKNNNQLTELDINEIRHRLTSEIERSYSEIIQIKPL